MASVFSIKKGRNKDVAVLRAQQAETLLKKDVILDPNMHVFLPKNWMREYLKQRKVVFLARDTNEQLWERIKTYVRSKGHKLPKTTTATSELPPPPSSKKPPLVTKKAPTRGFWDSLARTSQKARPEKEEGSWEQLAEDAFWEQLSHNDKRKAARKAALEVLEEEEARTLADEILQEEEEDEDVVEIAKPAPKKPILLPTKPTVEEEEEEIDILHTPKKPKKLVRRIRRPPSATPAKTTVAKAESCTDVKNAVYRKWRTRKALPGLNTLEHEVEQILENSTKSLTQKMAHAILTRLRERQTKKTTGHTGDTTDSEEEPLPLREDQKAALFVPAPVASPVTTTTTATTVSFLKPGESKKDTSKTTTTLLVPKPKAIKKTQDGEPQGIELSAKGNEAFEARQAAVRDTLDDIYNDNFDQFNKIENPTDDDHEAFVQHVFEAIGNALRKYKTNPGRVYDSEATVVAGKKNLGRDYLEDLAKDLMPDDWGYDDEQRQSVVKDWIEDYREAQMQRITRKAPTDAATRRAMRKGGENLEGFIVEDVPSSEKKTTSEEYGVYDTITDLVARAHKSKNYAEFVVLMRALLKENKALGGYNPEPFLRAALAKNHMPVEDIMAKIKA